MTGAEHAPKWIERYAQIPVWVVLDRQIDDGARSTLVYVLARLFSESGWYAFSAPEIARDRGRSEREVRRHLAALRDRGYLAARLTKFGGVCEYARGPALELAGAPPDAVVIPGPARHGVTSPSGGPPLTTRSGDDGAVRPPVTASSAPPDGAVRDHEITHEIRRDDLDRSRGGDLPVVRPAGEAATPTTTPPVPRMVESPSIAGIAEQVWAQRIGARGGRHVQQAGDGPHFRAIAEAADAVRGATALRAQLEAWFDAWISTRRSGRVRAQWWAEWCAERAAQPANVVAGGFYPAKPASAYGRTSAAELDRMFEQYVPDADEISRSRALVVQSYRRRWEAATRDVWSGPGRDSAALNDLASYFARHIDGTARIEAVLEGYFSSGDAFVRSKRWPLGLLARDPGRYVAGAGYARPAPASAFVTTGPELLFPEDAADHLEEARDACG